MTQPLTFDGSIARPVLPPVPLWVSVVMALDAIAFGLAGVMISVSGTSGDVFHGVIYGVLAGGPYLALPELMRRRPRPMFYGAAAAAMIGAGMLSLGALVLVSLGWSDTPGYEAGQRHAALLILVFALAQLAVIFWSLRAVAAQGRLRESLVGFGAMMCWPIIAGALATSGGMHADIALWRRRERESAALARTALRIQRCAIAYAVQHPDAGYPPSLLAMGPRQSKCLDVDDVAATHKGYAVAYIAEPADENGRVPAFVVRGSGRPARNVGIFSVWGDTSGTLRRAWGPNAVDERSIPGDGSPAVLGAMRDCIEVVRADGAVPTLADLARAPGLGPYITRGCTGEGVIYLADTAIASSYAQRLGYRFSYARDGESYRLDARPAAYGATGLRSYILADGGAIHFTLDDRAATTDDPELPACPAYDVGDCTPSSLDTPPGAQLLHDASIPLNGAYYLHVRASGDTARYPARLTWSFQCRVSPAETDPAPPLHFDSNMPDTSCPNPYYANPPVGDSLVARVWLRNEAGLTAHIDHVIRVQRDAGDAIR